MNRLFDNLIGVLVFIILMPLIIVGAIIVIPIIFISETRKRKRIRKWLRTNDYNYFLIYTNGRRKRKFFEDHVIPKLNPGIKYSVFDGNYFTGFIDHQVAIELSLYDNEGFLIIGKIEEGVVTKKSLKQEYKQLVERDKNHSAFIEELQNRIDEL